MKAEELANERFPENLYNEDTREKLMYGFIEGYNQATKGAVEVDATVCKLADRAWITPTDEKKFHQEVYDSFKAGDKVRLIVLKEKE